MYIAHYLFSILYTLIKMWINYFYLLKTGTIKFSWRKIKKNHSPNIMLQSLLALVFVALTITRWIHSHVALHALALIRMWQSLRFYNTKIHLNIYSMKPSLVNLTNFCNHTWWNLTGSSLWFNCSSVVDINRSTSSTIHWHCACLMFVLWLNENTVNLLVPGRNKRFWCEALGYFLRINVQTK